MKATGIVRRIDSSVIIGAKVRSLENTGFSLIFVQLHQYPKPCDEAAITTAPTLRKEEQQLNFITHKGVH